MTLKVAYAIPVSFIAGSLAIGPAAEAKQQPNPLQCIRAVTDFGPPPGCDSPEQQHNRSIASGLNGTGAILGSSVSIISATYATDFEFYVPDAPRLPFLSNRAPSLWPNRARSARTLSNWYVLNYKPPPTPIFLPVNEAPRESHCFMFMWRST